MGRWADAGGVTGTVSSRNRVWDVATLSWVVMSQPIINTDSLTVTGTFFQATQPVSLATAPTTPVTGTFWQATQPVSGTFWQTTQPVSLATAPTTPVTGTFWQATQPVSGTFWQATQPVSAARLPLPSGAALEAGGNLATIAAKDFATQATLALIKAKTDNLDAALSTLATAANQIAGGKTLKTAKFSLTATGTVVSAVGGKRIKAYAYKIVVSAAISVKWRDGAITDLEDLQSLALSGGEAESIMPPAFLFGTTAGNSLDLVISGVGTAAGRVSYFDDDGS
mgnify:CR=1 FL=1